LIVGGGVLWLAYQYLDTLRLVADSLVYARGRGSAESRAATYTLSVQAVLANPIGYGTQRDALQGMPVPGLPLGTHSQFIAVLFKYGWVGLLAFLGILWKIYSGFLTGVLSHLRSKGGEARIFFTALTWSMVSVVVHLIVIEVALDMTSFMMVTTLWVVVAMRADYYRVLRTLPPSDPVRLRPERAAGDVP
jgi:hypothetical protein